MRTEQFPTTFLASPEEILGALTELGDWCEEWSFAVATAHAENGCAKMWRAIEPHLPKLRYAIIGLDEYKTSSGGAAMLYGQELLRATEPWALHQFHQLGVLRVVEDRRCDFNPRFYLFRNGEEYRCVVGSAELSGRALGNGDECAVMAAGVSGSAFAVALDNFLRKCLQRARLITLKQLHSYGRRYMGIADGSDDDMDQELSEFADERELNSGIATSGFDAATERTEVSEGLPPSAEQNGNRAANERPDAREDINEISQEDLMFAIRRVAGDANQDQGMDRELAIQLVASRLGFRRVGQRIRKRLQNEIIAASMRDIIRSERGRLFLDKRSIDDYSRDDLKKYLAATMGRAWRDQDESIRAAAAYIGFKRVTESVAESFTSAIRSALLTGTLERHAAERNLIRTVRL